MRLILNLLAVSASLSPPRSANQGLSATIPGVLPIILAVLIVILLVLIVIVRFGGRRSGAGDRGAEERSEPPVAPHTPDDGTDPNEREIYRALPRPLLLGVGGTGSEPKPEPAPTTVPTAAPTYPPPPTETAPEVFPIPARTPWADPAAAAALTVPPVGAPSTSAMSPAGLDMDAIEPATSVTMSPTEPETSPPPVETPLTPTPPNGTPDTVSSEADAGPAPLPELPVSPAWPPLRADLPPPPMGPPPAVEPAFEPEPSPSLTVSAAALPTPIPFPPPAPAPEVVPVPAPVPAPAAAPAATSGPAVSPAPIPSVGGGEAPLILLIEDDERIAKFYTILFQAKGFRVENARDGVEGVDMAQALKPALILLDVMMPKMNGLMVLQTLRANPDTEKTPVVVLSNYMEPPLIQRALQLGAIEYVVKSQARPEQLVLALPYWLKGEPALH
jgi:CheY-like chemotaxis protein